MRVVLFINLRPGDKVEMELEDGGLVPRRESRRAAKLKRGKFGRPVLVAAEGPPDDDRSRDRIDRGAFLSHLLVYCPANNLFNFGSRWGIVMLHGQAECSGGGECG